MKITTTVKQLREGVKLSSKAGDEVRWESAGHLSAQLLDASGTKPLTNCTITVEIPKEGTVSLESDADGRIFHPDVPFQDYELDLGDKGKVKVPAVAARTEVHRTALPSVRLGWVDLMFVDDLGLPVVTGIVSIDGESIDLEHAEEPGRACLKRPIIGNSDTTKVTVGETEVDVRLPVLPVPTVVQLPKKASS